METIFVNTNNSNTSEAYRFEINLKDKINLKDPIKHGFSQLSI